MYNVRIFRHMPGGGPGILANILGQHGIAYEVIAVDKGQTIPPAIDDVNALIFLGAPVGVNAHLPWIAQERDLILQAVDAKLPMLGHSFGAELIAQALGASVVQNVVHRIGWFPVERMHNPLADEWLEDLPRQFEMFCWHNHAFSIPPGATAILGSEWCVNEGFVHHNVLALQGHLEMTADMIRSWIKTYGDQVYSPSSEVHIADNLVVNWESVIQGPDMITLNLPHKIAMLEQTARVIYGHWLQLITTGESVTS